MTCSLCGGTKIVHTEVSVGIMTVGPCPNCTDFIHKQYEQATNGLRYKNVIYGVARSGEEAVAIVRNELKLLEDKR